MTGSVGAQAGFTLIEVIVALFIFGLLAAAGVALLGVSVRAQAATSAKFDDMAALGRLNAALTADLAQAVERPARDENGVPLPAFRGEGGGPLLLGLVRRGWTNLDDAPRAELQKVEYRLENGVLRRAAYGAVDGAAPLASTEMMAGVRQLRMRYRWQGAWSDRWDPRAEAPLPQAIELQLVRRDGMPLRALFLVGTGYVPPLPEGGPLAPPRG
ncbi:MAG: type II secretion system protein GspJ [Proteobacteria bacterium SG_bin5]|nr:type II secretion system minor pseudopilin GspJ [Sphingomonas sp.]OQW43019.1 MAG: type II secretion system protein GspJ [Proteobacteria bacterium SG_bin5]